MAIDLTVLSMAKKTDTEGTSIADEIAIVPASLQPGGPGSHHLRFLGPARRKRQPISRNWGKLKKRITAAIACVNTGLVGFLIGVYAGEVPRIQYFIADQHHKVILGNVVLYIGLAISTFLFWPLPLLHGRKPYVLGALVLLLPLQFPQALVSDQQRVPTVAIRVGLLLPRAISGLVLGFANVNFLTTLLDLFGASLQSDMPHQELVVVNDVRRHGGGMGLWLGIWTWSFIASLAIGFLTGAGIINDLNPAWGFYIVVIMIAFVLLLNVIAPETRRSRHRHSVLDVVDANENVYQRVARGEIKLHISTEGPVWWWEEVIAGITLSGRMVTSRGFALMSTYLAWIYAEVVLIIVLLGALLSREYRWRPREVGAGVVSIAVGALFAIPLTKANLFSRDRKQGPRTDSMTFQTQFTWTSHMVRRIVFTVLLPLAGLAYTLASPGIKVHYLVPIFFAGFVGFLSNLAIAECIGLIMETYDTCDLQPGVNTKHRLQSMAEVDKRRRTTYSSFPRVSAGIFVSQTLAFLFAAAATGVGGVMSRSLSAQKATAITAGVLFLLTLLFTAVLWRFKSLQVIPDGALGTRANTADWGEAMAQDKEWKPVVIGNPSGKMRRMNALEMGRESRWTEIRRLNKLIRK
ncbi:hypothetical protein K490DRAFT_62246 [Saccharata proteae CBS 121410]|uniref:MFS general substrate transporter n=1 Tax=Saccharata proteae CBS 121410 TaxID=1314787 RepID=A0A9P4HZW7_9PEZI|nr:hypothetical protein K490DRAFT_62246 [Saccharata proteae CBS 121410]